MPNGVTFACDPKGKITEEIFVQFASRVSEKALEKYRERIGHRYIEVVKSSQEEARSYSDPPLKFLPVQRLGSYDLPRTVRRYIGIFQHAGLERMRSGADSAGYGGYDFPTHLSGRDLSYCSLLGMYDHRYGDGNFPV